MVIHLSAKILHNNTLGFSPQSKNHRAIVCLSLLHVILFNKQNGFQGSWKKIKNIFISFGIFSYIYEKRPRSQA
jgi:hypothetical protein